MRFGAWILCALLVAACGEDIEPLRPLPTRPLGVIAIDRALAPGWVVERVQEAVDLWAAHGLVFVVAEEGDIVLHDMDELPLPRGADGFETDEYGVPLSAHFRGPDGIRHIFVAEDVGDRNQTCMIARTLSYAVDMRAIRPHPSEPVALLDYTHRQAPDDPCPWTRADAIELCRSTGICEEVPPG